MSDSTPDSLGAWIRAHRVVLGLSQQDLAEKLVDVGGCQQNNISGWERGLLIPDAGQLAAITRALGIAEASQIALRDALAEQARRTQHAARRSTAAAPSAA